MLQFVIGPLHGALGNTQSVRQLLHRRQLLAIGQGALLHRCTDSVHQLLINGNIQLGIHMKYAVHGEASIYLVLKLF